jgi:hypothetical protein
MLPMEHAPPSPHARAKIDTAMEALKAARVLRQDPGNLRAQLNANRLMSETLVLPPASSPARPTRTQAVLEAPGTPTWEISQSRAALIRSAVQGRRPAAERELPPCFRERRGGGVGASSAVEPGSPLKQRLDAEISSPPRVSSPVALSPDAPDVSPSRKHGGAGFFADLDSWIGAARTVCHGVSGVHALETKLCSLAKLKTWEATFDSFAGGSGKELGLEGFAHAVRDMLAVTPQKVSDDAVAQFFRRVDPRSSTITATALQDYLFPSEARDKARVAFYRTDWEDVFDEICSEGSDSELSSGSLDLYSFFLAVRREQERTNHPIDFVPLTDRDAELIFRGAIMAGGQPSDRISFTQLEAFLKDEVLPQPDEEEIVVSLTDPNYVLHRVADAMRVASHSMDWNALFDSYDTTGNGSLDFDEFEHAVRMILRIPEVDISFEHLEQLFTQIVDGDDLFTRRDDAATRDQVDVVSFREFLWLDGLKLGLRRVERTRPWSQILAEIGSSGQVDLLTFAVVLTMVSGCGTEKLSKEEVERLFGQVQSSTCYMAGEKGGGSSGTIVAEQLTTFMNLKRQVTRSGPELLHQVHVRGVGVDGWDSTAAGKGTYEDAEKLKAIFMPFGGVVEVAKIRHRVVDGANTSWALVTMATAEGVRAAVSKSEGEGVFAGSGRLVVTVFSQKQAAVSKGAMGSVQEQAHETAKLKHGLAKDRHQIHVRGIGVDGWNGSEAGLGKYENATALRQIFEPFGRVIEVSKIRHRVADGANTSWALVTMGSSAAVDRALRASKQAGVFAGSNRLVLSEFNQKQASMSKGAMGEAQESAVAEKLLSRQQREAAKYLEARETINRRTKIDGAMEALKAARADRERQRAIEVEQGAQSLESQLQALRVKRLGLVSPRRPPQKR